MTLAEAYALFDIDPASTARSVTARYHLLLRRHHPDVVPSSDRAAAHEMTIRIVEAYALLRRRASSEPNGGAATTTEARRTAWLVATRDIAREAPLPNELRDRIVRAVLPAPDEPLAYRLIGFAFESRYDDVRSRRPHATGFRGRISDGAAWVYVVLLEISGAQTGGERRLAYTLRGIAGGGRVFHLVGAGGTWQGATLATRCEGWVGTRRVSQVIRLRAADVDADARSRLGPELADASLEVVTALAALHALLRGMQTQRGTSGASDQLTGRQLRERVVEARLPVPDEPALFAAIEAAAHRGDPSVLEPPVGRAGFRGPLVFGPVTVYVLHVDWSIRDRGGRGERFHFEIRAIADGGRLIHLRADGGKWLGAAVDLTLDGFVGERPVRQLLRLVESDIAPTRLQGVLPRPPSDLSRVDAVAVATTVAVVLRTSALDTVG